MKDKSHARAPGNKQVTVALDDWLLKRMSEEAKIEDRSRNAHIVRLLRQSVVPQSESTDTKGHGKGYLLA